MILEGKSVPATGGTGHPRAATEGVIHPDFMTGRLARYRVDAPALAGHGGELRR